MNDRVKALTNTIANITPMVDCQWRRAKTLKLVSRKGLVKRMTNNKRIKRTTENKGE